MQVVKITKNLQTIIAGTLQPAKDEHGNSLTIATLNPTIGSEEFSFRTETAARYWLETYAALEHPELIREGSRR